VVKLIVLYAVVVDAVWHWAAANRMPQESIQDEPLNLARGLSWAYGVPVAYYELG
jgi:hypothetical protein